VIVTLDPTVYAEIKKTSETHWNLSQMIETTFNVDKNGVEYLIQCDGFLNGGYYTYTILTDENGQWKSNSKNLVPSKSYGYDLWPEKDGLIKTDIEFPTQFISQYHLSLVSGYTACFFTYQIALSTTDTEKSGSISVGVYQAPSFAHMALVEYLSGLTTSIPTLLTVEHYAAGDVAFGDVTAGILNMAFVRNNVLVIINAPVAAATAIDLEIDAKIQSAPEWTANSNYPSYIEGTLTLPPEKDYGYATWPGKAGTAKTNVELPTELLTKYQATLSAGSNAQNFFYKVPMDEFATVKTGRVQASIFLTTQAAQLGLVNYLNELQILPPRLTNEAYKVGDVAFGQIFDGKLYLVFTRNNVMVVIQSQTSTTTELAIGMDAKIQSSPECQSVTTIPSFVLK